MGGTLVTAGPDGATDAGSIVLPFALTIPASKNPAPSAMSRLEPIRVFPANGWAGTQSAGSNAPFSLAKWLGISSATAQEIAPEEGEIARRGASARPLTAAEEFRLELYNAATRRLIALDPKNPELRGIATADYVPDEPALARRQAAVAEAELKASRTAQDDDQSDILVGPGIPGITGSKSLRISQAVEYSIAEAADAKTPEELLQSLATSAVRYADGPTPQTFGSDAHLILRRSLQALTRRRSPLAAEVSFLDGEITKEGKRGSIRVDVLIGRPDAPEAVYDLKTGAEGLTNARIAEIRSHLPREFRNIPIRQLRP